MMTKPPENAIWKNDTDYRSHKQYQRPCCPVCSATQGEPVPIVIKNGDYVCINCHSKVSVDRAQKKWLDTMSKTKIVKQKCFTCGAYNFQMKQKKDPITKKWVNAGGTCLNCGCKIMI